MQTPTTQDSRLKTPDILAIRHVVYTSLIGYLPVASSEQVFKFLAKRRRPWSERMRFMDLRVTPDINETNERGGTLPEIEHWLGRTYGKHLAVVPGFFPAQDSRLKTQDARWRLALPRRCAIHAYGRPFVSGILFQPLDRLNSFFLLSSAKLGGPRAARLSGEDQMYFTQFEEVTA